MLSLCFFCLFFKDKNKIHLAKTKKKHGNKNNILDTKEKLIVVILDTNSHTYINTNIARQTGWADIQPT